MVEVFYLGVRLFAELSNPVRGQVFGEVSLKKL